MLLVAVSADLAHSLALSRQRVERATGHVAQLLLMPPGWSQRNSCRVETIRLQAPKGSVIVWPAKGQRVLGRLVAQDQLLVDLVAAEGANSVGVEVRQDFSHVA